MASARHGRFGPVDTERAEERLRAERRRLEKALADTAEAARSDRDESKEGLDIADPAERLTAEQVDDALRDGLRERLSAVERAEERLRQGTYGRSVRSGRPIPDARLEADPAAELTVDEAE